jgi:hypothetical protein
MEDGSGLSKLIPNIATSPRLSDTRYIACLLLQGKADTIRQGSEMLINEMPSYSQLSATEVTNIINFIQHKWDPNFKENNIIDVTAILEECTDKN